ncbi:ELKS/Rab6-interacting/CAST family member 1-like [Ostrea edulis]|uniref:ELKS/Rab6-interacting/CAST family member 1-like n=1 Tax=Ostrea edulis TaxID=37623 RepID=UPI0024AFE486|nr:ELKS/Rab6-interacting/CAST family member 1-like [Ostrea edulis]
MAARSTSESEDRDFDEKLVKLSDIKAFFTCTICSCLLTGTSTTKCGHRYCAHCIQQWHQRQTSCPVCNKHLTINSETRDHQFDELLNTIKEKAVTEADFGARYLLESNGTNGNGSRHPVDQKMAEILCVLLPQKDKDLKEMVKLLITEKDKALSTLKEKDIPLRDTQIRILSERTKTLEEEVKQMKTLKEKLDKGRQIEVKYKEEKQQMKEEIQHLKGELSVLRNSDVTHQQREKELYGQSQQQTAEIQCLRIYLDEKTKALASADSHQKMVKQLEKEVQRRTNEAYQLQQFVKYKDLYDACYQEASDLQRILIEKESIILEQQNQVSNMNETLMTLSKQIQETPLSIHQAEERYQNQLQEMSANLRAFYENKSQTDIGLMKEHAEELARELKATRSKHLADQQRMHEENMKLLKEVERTSVSGPQQCNAERYSQQEASLSYYKNKVNELEQRLIILQNRSNSP